MSFLLQTKPHELFGQSNILIFSFLTVQLGSFYWPLCKVREPSSGPITSTQEPVKGNSFLLLSVFFFFTSKISIWFFLRISIPLLRLCICPHMLFFFSFKFLSILSVVILNSLWGESKICQILVWFWCSLCLLAVCFFLPFIWPWNSAFDSPECYIRWIVLWH